jgi:hypothetical protein
VQGLAAGGPARAGGVAGEAAHRGVEEGVEREWEHGHEHGLPLEVGRDQRRHRHRHVRENLQPVVRDDELGRSEQVRPTARRFQAALNRAGLIYTHLALEHDAAEDLARGDTVILTESDSNDSKISM